MVALALGSRHWTEPADLLALPDGPCDRLHLRSPEGPRGLQGLGFHAGAVVSRQIVHQLSLAWQGRQLTAQALQGAGDLLPLPLHGSPRPQAQLQLLHAPGQLLGQLLGLGLGARRGLLHGWVTAVPHARRAPDLHCPPAALHPAPAASLAGRAGAPCSAVAAGTLSSWYIVCNCLWNLHPAPRVRMLVSADHCHWLFRRLWPPFRLTLSVMCAGV